MSKGKQNRKAALKAQEEARRLQEAKERRQQTMIGVIVTVALVALIALGGFLYWRSHRPVKTQDLEQARQAVAKVKEKPSAANDQGGFLISSQGLGKPVAKAPTVEIYMDFMCPGCGALHRGLDSTLTGLVDAGQINLVIYPMSFMDRLSTDNYSTRTGTATIYVAQHDPDHLLPFIANLYAKDFQPDESDYHPISNDKIRQQAIKAGVDPKVADQAVKGHYRAWIKAMDTYTPPAQGALESLRVQQGADDHAHGPHQRQLLGAGQPVPSRSGLPFGPAQGSGPGSVQGGRQGRHARHRRLRPTALAGLNRAGREKFRVQRPPWGHGDGTISFRTAARSCNGPPGPPP